MLKLWDFVREAEEKGTSNLRRVCRESFLSFVRVREWRDVHRQLVDVLRELKISVAPRRSERADADAAFELLHRALLTGLLSRIATGVDAAGGMSVIAAAEWHARARSTTRTAEVTSSAFTSSTMTPLKPGPVESGVFDSLAFTGLPSRSLSS